MQHHPASTSPAIELLYRQALQWRQLHDGAPTIAAVNAHAHPLLAELAKIATVTVLQYFKPEADALSALGVAPAAGLPQACDLILLTPGKNKQQTLAWMATAIAALREGGTLLASCENRAGAKSYEAALRQLAGNVASFSKARCRCFSARRGDMLDHPLMDEWRRHGEPRLVEASGMVSQPGLFSWDRIDAGSRLLAAHLPAGMQGHGMDLCCGYGYLAARILDSHPEVAKLHMVDADAQALACARRNLQAATPQKVSWHWLDAAREPLPKRLDWIVCNPPFHAGHRQDIELGRRIIANGCRSLDDGGRIYLVANRKLPYEEVLIDQCATFRTVTQQQGFKILEGIR